MPPNHIRIECANKLLSLLRPSKPPSVQKKNHREKCVRLQFIYTYIIYIYTHNKIKQLRPTQTSILDIVDHDGGGGTVIHKIKTHCKDSQTYKHIYIYIFAKHKHMSTYTYTSCFRHTHIKLYSAQMQQARCEPNTIRIKHKYKLSTHSILYSNIFEIFARVLPMPIQTYTLTQHSPVQNIVRKFRRRLTK